MALGAAQKIASNTLDSHVEWWKMNGINSRLKNFKWDKTCDYSSLLIAVVVTA